MLYFSVYTGQYFKNNQQMQNSNAESQSGFLHPGNVWSSGPCNTQDVLQIPDSSSTHQYVKGSPK